MNQLDKHRILEKGDEYLTSSNGWKPVPSADLGIQIMFTKYTQVRRPGEAQNNSDTWAHVQEKNKPISPDSEKLSSRESAKAIVTAKAEGDKNTALSRSGAGDAPLTGDVDTDSRPPPRRLSPTEQLIEDAKRQALADDREVNIAAEAAKLAVAASATPVIDKEIPAAEIKPPKTTRREAKPAHKTDIKQVKWGDKALVWTGRNGTFGCLGIDMANYDGSFVSFVPLGKRGQGNCIIQIPVEAIPQIVEFLNRQLKRTT